MTERGLFYPGGEFKSAQEIGKKNGGQNGSSDLVDVFDYRHPTTPEEAAKKLGVSVDTVCSMANDLIQQGFGVVNTDKGYIKTRVPNPEKTTIDESGMGRYLKFGLVSDNHAGSKKERLDRLEQMYDIFAKEGVGVVYHAGDITEGHGVYRGQEFEVAKLGQDEQIDYVVATYPARRGITTKFITGNHDLRQYERGGIDPGPTIARRRQDLQYLGPMTASVNFKDRVKMELLHPAGGSAYALSYKAQRDINNRTPGDLPHILAYGHFHTSFYMYYRNIHFFQVPCFKDAGLWEKRLGLNPTIGGWMVEATIGDGQIKKMKPELYTFTNRGE